MLTLLLVRVQKAITKVLHAPMVFFETNVSVLHSRLVRMNVFADGESHFVAPWEDHESVLKRYGLLTFAASPYTHRTLATLPDVDTIDNALGGMPRSLVSSYPCLHVNCLAHS